MFLLGSFLLPQAATNYFIVSMHLTTAQLDATTNEHTQHTIEQSFFNFDAKYSRKT